MSATGSEVDTTASNKRRAPTILTAKKRSKNDEQKESKEQKEGKEQMPADDVSVAKDGVRQLREALERKSLAARRGSSSSETTAPSPELLDFCDSLAAIYGGKYMSLFATLSLIDTGVSFSNLSWTNNEASSDDPRFVVFYGASHKTRGTFSVKYEAPVYGFRANKFLSGSLNISSVKSGRYGATESLSKEAVVISKLVETKGIHSLSHAISLLEHVAQTDDEWMLMPLFLVFMVSQDFMSDCCHIYEP